MIRPSQISAVRSPIRFVWQYVQQSARAARQWTARRGSRRRRHPISSWFQRRLFQHERTGNCMGTGLESGRFSMHRTLRQFTYLSKPKLRDDKGEHSKMDWQCSEASEEWTGRSGRTIETPTICLFQRWPTKSTVTSATVTPSHHKPQILNPGAQKAVNYRSSKEWGKDEAASSTDRV